jgi:hypothetical protein
MGTESVSAQWAPDPYRRHELRYWNGREWTEHVSDHGVQSTDVVRSASPGAVWAPPRLEMLPPDARWRPVNGLKTALVLLFGATIVAVVAAMGSLVNRVHVVNDLEDAIRVTPSLQQRATDADDAVSVASVVVLALVIATGVVFIIWQWRTAKNAEALGRTGARYGPGWSIGGWFIPIGNLWIPVSIIQGFWRASSPGSTPGMRWRDAPRSALIGWWWALFLISGVFGRVGNPGGDSFDEVRTSDQVLLVGYVFTAGAALLAAVVVVKLTRRFNDRLNDASSATNLNYNDARLVS